MSKPNFLGLGAQKCASSWIHQVFADHPEIAVSEPKELDFFSHMFNRGYTWYETFFQDVGVAKAIGEISPSYFCDPLAPERVHAYDPNMKLIVALRDPVKRAFSNHLHEIRKRFFHGADVLFETGLASNPMYRFQSLYGRHLACWRRCFPAEQILVVLQEEIAQDPVPQARRLYEFLGVDPDYESRYLHKRAHESVGAHNETLYRTWRWVGDFGRRYGMGGLIETLKQVPPISTIMAANRRDLRAEIPPMRPETEAALQQEFAADMRQLAALLDREELPWSSWRAAQASPVVAASSAA